MLRMSGPLYPQVSITWDQEISSLIAESPLYLKSLISEYFIREEIGEKSGPENLVPYKWLSLITEPLISEVYCGWKITQCDEEVHNHAMIELWLQVVLKSPSKHQQPIFFIAEKWFSLIMKKILWRVSFWLYSSSGTRLMSTRWNRRKWLTLTVVDIIRLGRNIIIISNRVRKKAHTITEVSFSNL